MSPLGEAAGGRPGRRYRAWLESQICQVETELSRSPLSAQARLALSRRRALLRSLTAEADGEAAVPFFAPEPEDCGPHPCEPAEADAAPRCRPGGGWRCAAGVAERLAVGLGVAALLGFLWLVFVGAALFALRALGFSI